MAAPRRYSLNENAFDSATEESAYWIGFLMADGYIVRKKNVAPCGIGVALADALVLATQGAEGVDEIVGAGRRRLGGQRQGKGGQGDGKRGTEHVGFLGRSGDQRRAIIVRPSAAQ